MEFFKGLLCGALAAIVALYLVTMPYVKNDVIPMLEQCQKLAKAAQEPKPDAGR